jgi:hypothetical protein
MSCAKVQRLLVDFVGDDLSLRIAAPLRAHLQACNGCRGLASQQLQVQRALRTGVAAPVPESLFEELQTAVMAAVAQEPLPRLEPRRRWRAASVAAAALLFGGGLLLARPGIDPFWRAPIDTVQGALPLVQPYGPGAAATLRPLSNDYSSAMPGAGQGMMGRVTLRTLELDLGDILPREPSKSPASKPKAPGTPR